MQAHIRRLSATAKFHGTHGLGSHHDANVAGYAESDYTAQYAETTAYDTVTDEHSSAANAWIECKDELGQTYYWNETLGESKWTLTEAELAECVLHDASIAAATQLSECATATSYLTLSRRYWVCCRLA